MPSSRPVPSPVTVSMAFVRGMLSGLPGPGAAGLRETVLQQAGIAPALLDEPAARVTADQYVRLFKALIDTLDDEGLGLFSRPLRRGTLALVTRSALGADSVEMALARICRAFNVVQDDVRFSVAREGALTGLRLDLRRAVGEPPVFLHEMLLRVLLRLTMWLHGGRLPSFEFDVAAPRPGHADEYERLFPGPVRFDRPFTALWVQRGALAQPLRRDEASLRDFLAQTPGVVVVARRRGASTAARVRACLQATRPRWPGLDEVAQALRLPVSTLQRHLAREGESFQGVKDQLRRDIAIERLIGPRQPLAALAAELGFSDSATFQRAFKAWTGSPAGAYRHHRAAE